MTIGLQAYLRGYMHEKTAMNSWTPREDLLKYIADHPDDRDAPIYLEQQAARDRATADARRRTTQRLASPYTIDTRGEQSGDAQATRYMSPYQRREYLQRPDIIQRRTAQDKAEKIDAARKTLSQNPEGTGRRRFFEGAYNVARHLGNPFRMALGEPGSAVDPRRGYAGTSTRQDKALSEKMQKRYGAPAPWDRLESQLRK